MNSFPGNTYLFVFNSRQIKSHYSKIRRLTSTVCFQGPMCMVSSVT